MCIARAIGPRELASCSFHLVVVQVGAVAAQGECCNDVRATVLVGADCRRHHECHHGGDFFATRDLHSSRPALHIHKQLAAVDVGSTMQHLVAATVCACVSCYQMTEWRALLVLYARECCLFVCRARMRLFAYMLITRSMDELDTVVTPQRALVEQCSLKSHTATHSNSTQQWRRRRRSERTSR
jgi:hypothetical protein